MHRPLLLVLALLVCGCAVSQRAVTHPSPTWSTDASAYRGQEGQRVVFVCPPNPDRAALGTVWGAEVYTDDSAVCVAAVHAGRISFAEGGRVTLEVRPGQSAYRGTDWNGVVSEPYGPWGGSFVFSGR